MDNDFINEQITIVKAQITAYNAALTALITGGVQSYSIDTGQSIQKVTKLDIGELNKMRNSLYNQLATLQARLNGAAVLAVPGW